MTATLLVEVSADLLEQSRATNAAIEELLASMPSAHTVDVNVTRAARAEGRGPFGPIEHSELATERTIPGPAGDLHVRVIQPERVDGVYLHIHAGGWTLGASDHSDPLLANLAKTARVAVVSVEYRLAPEHPYPAGPDDCEAAARWVVEHAKEEFGSDRLVIGGESAGAHLAVLTLLRLRDDAGGITPFAGANLVYGPYDLGMTPSQRRWGDRNLILSTPIMEWFYDCFTPGRSPEGRRDPSISPLYADLRALPPARFTVGTLDPLLDDSLFMEARWRAAGNEAELAVYPESVHGFTLLRTGIGELASAAQAAFVRRALGPS